MQLHTMVEVDIVFVEKEVLAHPMAEGGYLTGRGAFSVCHAQESIDLFTSIGLLDSVLHSASN